MNAGIYILTFSGTDKVYVGKSVNLDCRFYSHMYTFRNNIASKKLQSAYDIFGEPKFDILECAEVEQLNYLEKYYISEFDSVDNGFNTSYGGESGNCSNGEDNGRSLHTNEEYINMLELIVSCKYTIKTIATLCNTTERVVSHIASGETHRWLSQACPDLYSKLLALKGSRHKKVLANKRKYHTIVDPEGNVYNLLDEDYNEFCKKHSLSRSRLSELLNGHTIQYRGWHTGTYKLANKRPDAFVVSPHGETFQVQYGNYSKFAKTHGLDPGAFRKVIVGQANHHKGWKLLTCANVPNRV